MSEVRRRLIRWAIAAFAVGFVAAAPSVGATPPPPTPAPAPAESTGGLIDVPVGCPVPDAADLAFVGTAVAKDFEKVRFQIVQLRAGSSTGYAVDGLLDVLYFEDAKFLDVGEDYLVGARFEPEFGSLYSTVRPAEPLFGGNDVIGLNDTDIECPTIDDPVRTVLPDGTSVDSGVISPLLDDKTRLAATLGVPTAIVFGVIIALVLLRKVWGLFLTGVFELGRAAVTPSPDHTSVRTRSHRSDDAVS